MVHGAVRKLFQLLGALVAGLLIALPLVAWRLASGPIVLDFLTPTIEEALSATDGGFTVDLETTVLAMAEGDRLVEVRALNVRAFAGGEQPIATVPEVALSINGRALLSGVLAPNAIRVYKPQVRLVRNEDGSLQWDVGAAPDAGRADDAVRRLLDALVGEPDPSQPGRHLKRASIIDADIQVEDRRLGVSWHAPDADIALRRTPTGLQASAQIALDLADEVGTVAADLAYSRADDGLDGTLTVSGIRPALLARLGGPLTPLSMIDMPLAGNVRVKGKADGTLSELWIDLAGGAGRVSIPDPIKIDRAVVGVTLRGGAFDNVTKARLDEFTIDLGGTTVSLAANADGLGGVTTVNADAVLRNVPFDDLPHLWPEILAPNARDWVVANMSAGMVHEARATLSARSPSGRFDDVVIDHLEGGMEGEGVTVDYLRPMPKVVNGKASASFDTKDFRISIQGGQVYGLNVKDGLIVLSGLADIDQYADIDLTIAGPAADALKLIDHPPLRYAQALGIQPGTVGGGGTTRLRLKFPLLKTLRLDDVEVKAHSVLKGVSLPKVALGLDLSQGDLDLTVDAKGLDAFGPVVLGTIPGELKWRENFAKAAPFRSRYQLAAPRIDESQRRELGLDGPPFVAPFVAGPVSANVTATLFGGGRGDIEAKVDLSPATMRLPGLGWRKEERTTGGAEVLVKLDKLKLASIPRFQVQAGDLQARGSVSFNADGSARRVDFDRLAYGRTDIAGTLTLRKGGGFDVVARGPSFDAAPLLGSDEEEEPAEPQAESRKTRKSDLPPMSVSAAVGTMWLSKKGGLKAATAEVSRDAEDWRTLNLKGQVGEGKAFSAEMRPNGPTRRDVAVRSDDAGAVARVFDVYDDMVGGKLDITGYYDDTREDQPIIGTVKASDYNIVNAPALAKLLNVAALTGVVDLLNNQGITFTTLEAPFTLAEGLVEVKDARAYGPAIGITAKGQIDLDHSRLALEGTVVPAYALNSVLGKIPVLGWLITGGEKGGGLVAFNYSMKGPTIEPDVLVNPLSALTPGFLRNLFNIFDDGSETEARKKTK